mmetsp:Transcript_3240/g.4897  ORF Transcript_3240/g.4897 Transcript_3240/m.4897 type:complete len:297 (-) Transcript_3240:572-1462(-)
MSSNANQNGRSSSSKNRESHDVESGLNAIKLTEAKSEAHGTYISSGSNNSRDGPSSRRVYVRDDTIGGSLSGLNEGRKDDQNEDGQSKILSLCENQYHRSLNAETNGLPDETSTHSKLRVHFIAGKSSKTTGEKIHPSKNRGDCGGTLSRLKKLLLEVRSGSVVHGKLNSETASIVDEKQPSVEIQGTSAEGRGSRYFLHDPVPLQICVVTLWRVIRDPENGESSKETNTGRDDAHSTPCSLGAHSCLEKGEKNSSHDNLSNSSSEVTPAPYKGISGSSNLFGEHCGSPVLTHNEA